MKTRILFFTLATTFCILLLTPVSIAFPEDYSVDLTFEYDIISHEHRLIIGDINSDNQEDLVVSHGRNEKTELLFQRHDRTVPETPDLVHRINTHCCPSCARMWRIIDYDLKEK